MRGIRHRHGVASTRVHVHQNRQDCEATTTNVEEWDAVAVSDETWAQGWSLVLEWVAASPLWWV